MENTVDVLRRRRKEREGRQGEPAGSQAQHLSRHSGGGPSANDLRRPPTASPGSAQRARGASRPASVSSVTALCPAASGRSLLCRKRARGACPGTSAWSDAPKAHRRLIGLGAGALPAAWGPWDTWTRVSAGDQAPSRAGWGLPVCCSAADTRCGMPATDGRISRRGRGGEF